MSPALQAFGGAVEGQIPETFNNAEAVVVGMKGADPWEIAKQIRQAVDDGAARPVNWLAATTKVAPSGGLAPKGGEAPYHYKGADMFGLENPPAKLGQS